MFLRTCMTYFYRLILVFLLCVGGVHASVSTVQGFSYSGAVGGPWASLQLGCNGFKAQYSLAYVALLVDSSTSGRCYNSNAAGTAYVAPSTTVQASGSVCPVGSTLTAGSCVCNTGYDEVNGSCVAHVNACAPKVGRALTINFTEGYTRTTDEGDRSAVGGVNTPPVDGVMCSAGCKVSAQTSGPGVQPYVSSEPTAQGLYRRSLDMPAQHLGLECTGSGGGSSATHDASVNPSLASPACTGFVGEVNGKLGCFGTAQAPVTTAPMPRNNAPSPVPGNPAAGDKPVSGEGSGSTGAGRTPSAGNGGNAGGPAAAGVGKGGDGTVSKPVDSTKEQQNCGAPGQPKCKLDEAGTPADAGTSFDAAKTALDTNKDSAKTAIDAAAGMQAPSWSFSFALPTGCTAFNTGIRGFVMNPCQYQSTIHDLMSMVWAAVTAFFIIGMVGRTIRES